MEAKMLLRDSEVFPSDMVLKNALGEATYNVFEAFLKTISEETYNLTVEWRYYNDGKAWLAKIAYKKKTIMWLSVWEGFFKTSFYFTEKYLEAIAALNISDSIKQEFAMAKTVGKLIPMIICVSADKQLEDLLTVVLFKKSLK